MLFLLFQLSVAQAAESDHSKWVEDPEAQVSQEAPVVPAAPAAPAEPSIIKKVDPDSPVSRSPLYWAPTLGLGVLGYHENYLGRQTDYSMWELSARLGVIYRELPSRWEVGFAGSITAATFDRNMGDEMRFLGLNLRVGYHLPQLEEPWDVSLQAGGYYTTTFVTNSDFGFRNLEALQLYPTVRRRFANGTAVKGYFKVAPILSQGEASFFSNRELAIGAKYVIPFNDSTEQSWSVGIDASQLTLNVPQTGGSFVVHSSSVSLGVGVAY